MHLVLVNCLGGLNLPRNSVVSLTDRPDMNMTIAVYRGCKATKQFPIPYPSLAIQFWLAKSDFS